MLLAQNLRCYQRPDLRKLFIQEGFLRPSSMSDASANKGHAIPEHGRELTGTLLHQQMLTTTCSCTFRRLIYAIHRLQHCIENGDRQSNATTRPCKPDTNQHRSNQVTEATSSHSRQQTSLTGHRQARSGGDERDGADVGELVLDGGLDAHADGRRAVEAHAALVALHAQHLRAQAQGF